MRRANILIAIPCHSGQVEFTCVRSLMALVERLKSAGIRHEVQFVAGNSQITSVRNYFGNRVAFDSDDAGRPFTHLLFIDSDVSGFENDVLKILKADKPISALAYTLKIINWERVAQAARAGVPAENLADYAGSPVIVADISFPTMCFLQSGAPGPAQC